MILIAVLTRYEYGLLKVVSQLNPGVFEKFVEQLSYSKGEMCYCDLERQEYARICIDLRRAKAHRIEKRLVEIAQAQDAGFKQFVLQVDTQVKNTTQDHESH